MRQTATRNIPNEKKEEKDIFRILISITSNKQL